MDESAEKNCMNYENETLILDIIILTRFRLNRHYLSLINCLLVFNFCLFYLLLTSKDPKNNIKLLISV